MSLFTLLYILVYIYKFSDEKQYVMVPDVGSMLKFYVTYQEIYNFVIHCGLWC